MKLLGKNYPYPILIEGSDDYIDSKFEINIIDGPKENEGNILLEIEYELSSKGLKQMIDNSDANVLVRVSCPSTSYRETFTFEGNTLEIEIPKNYLGAKVEFASFIVATKDINNFMLDEHNKTYFIMPSSIRKGDRLAIGDVVSFKLEFYDALRPIASIITIKENKIKKAEAVTVDLTNDKIIIYLNSDLFEKYKQLREYPDLRLYLSTNIVMPAIIEALAEMKWNYTPDLEKRWELSLKKILKSIKVDLFTTELSLYTIANKIFKNGLFTSMKSLELFFNIEENENEN